MSAYTRAAELRLPDQNRALSDPSSYPKDLAQMLMILLICLRKYKSGAHSARFMK